MITIVIHNSQFIIHNYDYFRLLCLLLHITCELVNLSTRQLQIMITDVSCGLSLQLTCSLVYSLTCLLVLMLPCLPYKQLVYLSTR